MELNPVTKGMSNAAETIDSNFVKIKQDLTNQVTRNGYQHLPGGLILQWGTFKSTTNNTSEFSYDVNFNIPFNSEVFHVEASIKTVTGSVFLSKLYTTQATATSLELCAISGKRVDGHDTTGELILTWFAIGV